MIRNRKFFTIGAVFAFVLMSAAVFAAQQQATNATLSFSGIHIVENQTSHTPQGFIDISLKNIETPGISFCFEYDNKYIQLSDADTNLAIVAPTGANDHDHKYFKQNTDAFPIDSFIDDNANSIIDPVHPMVIGTANPDISRVIMTFVPQSESFINSEYIEYKSVDEDSAVYDQPVILADKTEDGVSFGQISFRVVDPVGLARLSEDELKDIVKIVPLSAMLGDDITTEDDIINKFGLHMSYYIYPVENVAWLEWYPCTERNIEYNMGIDADLISVKPQNTEFTVSAYDIYNTGSVDDLFRYLNEKASVLTLEYADGTQFPAAFQWSGSESSVTGSWDPKGGTYTVKQPFNENISVSVTVNVTPVSLVDFDFENENKTYYVGMEGFPATFDDLQLPKTARPVLDTYTPNCGLAEITIDWYREKGSGVGLTTLPDGFGESPPESYEIEGMINNVANSLSSYPWLTVSEPTPTIIANRYVVATADEMPKAIEAEAVTDDNGVMTVTVKNTDGSQIPEGTTFTVKMPNGQKIDGVGTKYTVSVNEDGTATITFDPDMTDPEEQLLARLINLGSRAGEFSIASKEPEKNQSEYVNFASNPRNNYYLPPNDVSDIYEFDYSREMSAMLPIQAGGLPPTTITLIDGVNSIKTTYSGYDGDEEGVLKTFTVDEWDTISGEPETAGSVVEIEGILSDTSYTNYGEVTNKDKQIKVKIKYLAAENMGEDAIEHIDDFVFDPKEVGYDYDELQTHTFTIHNTGETDIYGLSAVIALSTVTDSETPSAEAFLLKRAPIGLLEKDARTEFDISTKYGLPVGKYVSTVSIYSNNKLLDSFKVSFEVTAEPVYKIVLKAEPSDLGKAETETKTYTAKAGEEITILATPNTDCEFVNWSTENEDVVLKPAEKAKQTFFMPAHDVEITANFKETVVARLRAAELYVKDAKYETASDPSEPFYDSKWKHIDYDPITNEYYVAVPNDMEKVKLWFKPREEIAEKTTTITHEHGESTDTLGDPTKGDSDYYISDEIELDLSPVDNIVKLTFEYEDPDDGPGKKEYTIHIFRKLTAAEMVEFNYGNSPYGLIMRDDTITAENKDTVKQEFIDNGRQFKETVPQGAKSGVVYTPKAWINDNYDENDAALFVTDYSSFTDPGYKELKTSIGTEVSGKVTKTVSVFPLLASGEDMNGTIDDFNNISHDPLKITLTESASGAITSLSGRRIRPDIYMLTYTFADFDGQQISVSKPLIILSKLGDVNISGNADVSDVSAIMNRFTDLLADEVSVSGYTSGGRLFKYRICDANKDGFINAIDANFIKANKLDPFYTNLTQGGGG